MSGRIFYKTTWKMIDAGDTVLVAAFGQIVEVEVKQCRIGRRSDGRECVVIEFEFGEATCRDRFDANAPAYMRNKWE